MRELLYQLVDSRRTKRFVTHAPADLFVVAGFVALVVTVVDVASVSSPVVLTALGLPLLFLVPGYVVVATIFPRSSPTRPGEGEPILIQTRSVSDRERLALAFGLSVAVVPLFGLLLSVTSWGVTGTAVVRAIAGFALLGTVLAAVRRRRVPSADRYRFRPVDLLGSARSAVFSGSAVHTLANLFVVASVLLALSSVGYALAAPQDGEAHSELSVLTEDEDGELVAAGYPEEMTAGEPAQLTVGVDNHEGERTEYELLVVVERVDTTDDEATVFEREELETLEVTLEDGDALTHDHEVTPTMTGDDLRVSYLLYEGELPDDPTAAEATEHVYFWTDVEA